MRVRGEAVLAEALGPGAHLLRLLVEDVGRADAAATVAGRTELPLSGPLPAGTAVPFEIEVERVDPAAHYSVRAHLDRSGSGFVEAGDLVSTQAYPVAMDGRDEAVRVTLKPA